MNATESVAAQTPVPTLEARHYSSGLNTRLVAAPATFSEYIAHSRKIIAQAHAGIELPALNKIIDGNAPFELRPGEGYPAGKQKTYQRGILLTHGLTDSPYFMRHLATFFQEHGFLVMGVLLPGHGTQPGDLLEVRWQEWAKIVEYGIGQLAKEVDEIYLGGYSAGGALSIYQSVRDERVRGLFLFAPALKVSPKAAFARFHKTYSWLLPTAKWLNIKPDADIYKYESFPKNAAAQMHALTRVVKAQLARHKLQIPIFTVVSQDDATVDTDATIEFMAHTTHPSNKLLYYFSDAEKIPAKLEKDKIECVSSVLPEQKINSLAHTAIVIPREDGHYGEQGEYSNCHHYYPHDMAKYLACIDQQGDVAQGEITEKTLKQGMPLRRLTYNPHFATMKAAMEQFIDKLPAATVSQP